MITRASEIRERKLKADVAIIGSGPGGGSMAYYLAQRGIKVILIEEGSAWLPKDYSREYGIAMPTLYAEQGLRVATGRNIFPVAGGRGLGGGTLVNSGLAFDTPDFIVDEWRNKSGIEWLTPDYIRPHQQWVNDYLHVSEIADYHIDAGEKLLIAGNAALGWRGGVMKRNAPGCIGCGVCNFGCPSGGKAGTDRTFIPHSEQYGARIIVNAKVDKILTAKGAVAGISAVPISLQGEAQAERFDIEAKAVVVAAGAIETARLLINNGVGGDAVGRYLHLHPSVGMVPYFPDKICNGWEGVPQAYYSDEFVEDGFVLEGVYIAPEGIAPAVAPMGSAGQKFMRERFRHFAPLGSQVRDVSVGHIKGGKALGSAKINYTVGDEDLQKIRDSMVKAAQVAFAAGAAEIAGMMIGVGWHKNIESWSSAMSRLERKNLTLYSSHAQGSCPIGVDPKTSVAGADFQVHRTKGLFLADSSVFPAASGVNPQITIMTLSRIASEYVAGYLA